MAGTDDRDLIVAVSRDLVGAVAPEEMAVFPAVSAAYFDRPSKLSQAPKDDMLGFGAGEAVVFLTPVALSVVTEVLAYLRQELAQAAAKDAAGALHERVRAIFRRFHSSEQSPAPAPGLTEKQLAEVRRVAFETASAMHISESRAHLLADAVAGSLVPAT